MEKRPEKRNKTRSGFPKVNRLFYKNSSLCVENLKILLLQNTSIVYPTISFQAFYSLFLRFFFLLLLSRPSFLLLLLLLYYIYCQATLALKLSNEKEKKRKKKSIEGYKIDNGSVALKTITEIVTPRISIPAVLLISISIYFVVLFTLSKVYCVAIYTHTRILILYI